MTDQKQIVKQLEAERDVLKADVMRYRYALQKIEEWASSIYDGYPETTSSHAAKPYRRIVQEALAIKEPQ